MKKNLFIIMLSVACVFGSCSKKLTDAEIQDNIKMHYLQMGLAAGAGNWKANEIRILKKSTNDKGQKFITAEIKGIYESPPLGNPVPDELFCDTLVFEFKLNKHGLWECNPEIRN